MDFSRHYYNAATSLTQEISLIGTREKKMQCFVARAVLLTSAIVVTFVLGVGGRTHSPAMPVADAGPSASS